MTDEWEQALMHNDLEAIRECYKKQENLLERTQESEVWLIEENIKRQEKLDDIEKAINNPDYAFLGLEYTRARIMDILTAKSDTKRID